MTRLGQPWAASTRAVREWFEAGNTGTVREVAGRLTMNRKTVQGCVLRLKALKLVRVVGVREVQSPGPNKAVLLAPVYGAAGAATPSLVRQAMATRSPLEQAWRPGA